MKLFKSSLLLSTAFVGSFMIMSANEDADVDTDATEVPDQSEQLTEYKNSLQQEYVNLRKLIIKAAPKDVLKLNTAFKKIQHIEKAQGIPALQRSIAELRVEACQKQIDDTEIKALVDESIEKTKEIDKLTKPEQKKSEELTQQMKSLMEKTKDKKDPAVKKLQQELKAVQNKMREKSNDQITLIQTNNSKIYKKLADLMKKGAGFMKELKAKYAAAKESITPHDKTVANTTKAIEKALQKHESQLKRIRKSIKDLRTKIYEIEPCYSAQESLDDLDKDQFSWEQLFIS